MYMEMQKNKKIQGILGEQWWEDLLYFKIL